MTLAACAAFASAAVAKSSDRNQTMHVDAGGSDCTINDSGTCVLSGGVKIQQGTLDVRQVDGDPRSVKLTGSPVRLKQEMDSGELMNAIASQVDYDLAEDIIVFVGNATVQQPGRSSIAGDRIVYNMRTGQIQGGGEGSGRVRIQFEPRNKAATPPAGGND
nr:LptA, protein essential for LPS transport across the periplasm [uncultured bacterium]